MWVSKKNKREGILFYFQAYCDEIQDASTYQTFYTTEDLPTAAWTEEDAKVIFAMKKGLELKVTGESSRGTVTNDTYTLNGFTAAYNKLTEEC